MGCSSSQPTYTAARTEKAGAKSDPSLHVQSVASDISVDSAVLRFDDDWKAVHSAARWNKLEDLKQYLQDPRAVNCVDTKNGNIPVHISAQNGHLDGLELLIKYKADVNAQNGKGNTALHMAICYDYLDCAKLLIANGAREDLQNAAGFPAGRGLEGNKCLGIVAFNLAERNKSKELAIEALDLCAGSISSLTKANFAATGLKVKKALGDQWTEEIQEKFKNIMDQLE